MVQRVGGYRERVIIQSPTETRDGAGQPVTSWSEFGVRWMERRTRSAAEAFAGGVAVKADAVAEFRTHYTRGVTAKMRLLVPTAVTKLSSTATGVSAVTSATQTTLLVTTAAGFPPERSHRLRVASELMAVTAGYGTTTWTVTRGVDGTTAATAYATGVAAQLMQPYDIESADTDWLRGVETVIAGRLSDGVA